MTTNSPIHLNLPTELTTPTAFPLLGRIITWSIGTVALRRDQLVTLCQAAGLDTRMLPARIQTRSAVIRTIDRLEGDGFVRRILEEPDRAVFVLVSEAIDRDHEAARYRVERKFQYLKRERVVVCDDPATQAQIDALMEHFGECFLPADIRRFVIELVRDAGAITLRPRGGVYFLAQPKFAVVDALAKFVDGLGAGCSLLALNVPRSPSDAAGILKAFEAEALGELETLALELTELEADASRVRASTWSRKLDTFNAQRAKVGLYADLLKFESQHFIDRLGDLERRVRSHLVG